MVAYRFEGALRSAWACRRWASSVPIDGRKWLKLFAQMDSLTPQKSIFSSNFADQPLSKHSEERGF
jgi:hypothetical protein